MVATTRASQAQVIPFPGVAQKHSASNTAAVPEPMFTSRRVLIEFNEIAKHWLGLYMPKFRRDGIPVIFLDPEAWADATPHERRVRVCHELAHHLTGTTYNLLCSEIAGEHINRRMEPAVQALGEHLARCPNLGQLLVATGVLSADDGAWLDSIGAETQDLHA